MASSDDVPLPVVVGVFGAIALFGFLAIAAPLDEASPGAGQVAQTAVEGAMDFDTEWRALDAAVGCGYGKVTDAQFGMGRLYGCIEGAAETAKLFINEEPDRAGRVKNIKVMWNEWKSGTADAGADRREVSKLARAVMRRYAANLEDVVVEAYWGQSPKAFESGGIRFEYRWTPGPGINEHLLTVVPAQ